MIPQSFALNSVRYNHRLLVSEDYQRAGWPLARLEAAFSGLSAELTSNELKRESIFWCICFSSMN